MILCYSGTGNSKYVAELLEAELGDEIIRLSPGHMAEPSKVDLLVDNGRLIWIFPVHSWGMAKVIKRTILRARIHSKIPLKHFMICTCGDDAGLIDKQWRKWIHKRGWQTYGAYSVQMPNTYVFFPGFDVDAPQLAQAKLDAVPAKVKEIANSIDAEERVTQIVRGSFPWIKSKILYPLFMRFLTRTKPFHYTSDCHGCGKCAKNCPINAIEMVEGHPRWNRKECIMCTRCYQACPNHAIAYGNTSLNKGQYMFPGYNLK